MSKSRLVIYAAGAANLAIAVAKIAAWAFTGSSAMLTEGIHSVVDTGDQALLLLGDTRGEKAADPSHPFGYGMEVYFWSFVVALMIFALGGAASVYEGINKLQHPEPITRPWVNFLVLGLGVLFEATSLFVAVREFRRSKKPGRGMLAAVRRSKDPSVFTVLLEDSAALAGLALALVGVTAATQFGLGWADGAASIAIGILLVLVAAFLAYETRSLLVGESAPAEMVEAILSALKRHPDVATVAEVPTLQLGPRHILVVVCLNFRSTNDLSGATTDIVRAVKACDKRIGWVFLSPLQSTRRTELPL